MKLHVARRQARRGHLNVCREDYARVRGAQRVVRVCEVRSALAILDPGALSTQHSANPVHLHALGTQCTSLATHLI